MYRKKLMPSYSSPMGGSQESLRTEETKRIVPILAKSKLVQDTETSNNAHHVDALDHLTAGLLPSLMQADFAQFSSSLAQPPLFPSSHQASSRRRITQQARAKAMPYKSPEVHKLLPHHSIGDLSQVVRRSTMPEIPNMSGNQSILLQAPRPSVTLSPTMASMLPLLDIVRRNTTLAVPLLSEQQQQHHCQNMNFPLFEFVQEQPVVMQKCEVPVLSADGTTVAAMLDAFLN
jgi:hypothetical protein